MSSEGEGSQFDDPENLTIESADAIVHLEYTFNTLPSIEHVSKKYGGGHWTRFVCISDTHNKTFPVPDGDVLMHSGDLTKLGTERDMKATMDWIYSLPHKVKVVIAGNHDLTLHKDWYLSKWEAWHKAKQSYEVVLGLMTGPLAKESGVIYLENQKATFRISPERREWTVYGSPWSPEFFNWAFNYEADQAENLISSYENADLLLTHGPPHKIFDSTARGDLAGCPTLATHLMQGRLRPRIHLFGHIHEAHGAHIHSWEDASGPCEPLEVQNDINYPIELSASDSEEEVEEVEKIRSATGRCRRQAEERNSNPGLDRTVFVNGANEPGGRNRWRNGRKVGHGGPGFRPVVVDLKD